MEVNQIKKFHYWICLLLLLFFMPSCAPELPDDVALEYDQIPDNLDYNVHVKPILSDKCFSCHGPDQAKLKAELRLDLEGQATGHIAKGSGRRAISPNSLKNSEVFHRILSEDLEIVMPTPESNLELSAREKAVIIKWIEGGANYKPHWAFEKLVRQDALKSVESWGSNGIDYFVNKKLEAQNLQPSAQATKEVLLRRVSFDLIGLPPSLPEVQSFLDDDSPDAYEKQVDRLLSSVHYGEKMAINWMDLARYSDTHGYQADFYRDVSPWRDWVIEAYNRNMRYDDFIEWQLAGDMMPNPSKEQILATTFNRLHPQNLEGGIVDEEYRVEYVADRVSILGTGLMGLSLACAKCHDHKFDPISQKNFFELYSFFNNVNETGQIPWERSMPVPTLLLTKDEEQEMIDYLEKLVSDKSVMYTAAIAQAKEEALMWMKTNAFQKIKKGLPKRGIEANYSLNGNLKNSINPRQIGKMDREFSANEVPVFTNGKEGKGLLMDGDAWLDLDKVGVFQRKDAFSVGIWVNIPSEVVEGVIFHKNKGARLHSYRGYHLYLKDNKLQVMLAHTWPDNAIVEYSLADMIKDEWVQLTMTYDGSSKASGLKLYMNGTLLETSTEIDNLYKDIIFFNMEDNIYANPVEPGLQIGARWRGIGIPEARVDDIVVYSCELSQLEVLQLSDPDGVEDLLTKSYDNLSASDKRILENHFISALSTQVNTSAKELQMARGVLYDSIEQVSEIMVMSEMEEPRQTYVLERGLYDSYGEEVFPNVPENILAWLDSLPKNRLGLAKWLTNKDHPLTARVAVNRYWQNYFGRGLVRTTEDFGNQGEMPSHSELLDWLALEFIESGWDIKAMQKLIVMSDTYRQDSNPTPELLAQDPDNELLARGPRSRLSSEMIRDNALAVSGLLNDEIGGESVYPYQPKGLWSMNTGEYTQDSGDKLYRRSLYSFWKRTVPNPTLYTFDQPDREVCIVRRQKTNTPLQALILLNDPTFLEAAKVIGESMTRSGYAIEESIAFAYRNITGTEIEEEELKVLASLQESEYHIFKKDKDKKKGWLSAGDYQIDPSLDGDLVAANAIVASVILNSDASITKR